MLNQGILSFGMSYDIESIGQTSHYEIHTPLFEGPLGLLLHLIEKEKLDITQIALAQVTDQFLAHVEAMRGRLDIEVVADFLAVAARLILIKSRVLLPRTPDPASSTRDEDDIGDELVRQLRAYRQYKEAAQWLRERDHAGLHSYIGTTPPVKPQCITLDLSDITLKDLRDTAKRLFYPSEGPRPQEAIQKPRLSIVQQIHLIRKRLMQADWNSPRKATTFGTLLSSAPTRLEAVVTLQAILELIKQCAVYVTQASMFGEIIIEALIPPEEIAESVSSPAELSPPQPNQ